MAFEQIQCFEQMAFEQLNAYSLYSCTGILASSDISLDGENQNLVIING